MTRRPSEQALRQAARFVTTTLADERKPDMSEMPERIWASGGHVIEWDTTIGTFSALCDPNRTEYRRADAPPTVADAMQCPEVRALVEAVATSEDDLGDGTWNEVRDALRPFTEGQEKEDA